MGNIIIPFGKPVLRVMIDIDDKGQAQLDGKRIVAGKVFPLRMIDTCSVLANALAGSIGAICGSIPMNTKAEANNNGSESKQQRQAGTGDNPEGNDGVH